MEASTTIAISALPLSGSFSPEQSTRGPLDGICALLTATLQPENSFQAHPMAILATQEPASGSILNVSLPSFCSATGSTPRQKTSKSANSARCSTTASSNASACSSGKHPLHRHNRKRNQLQRLLTKDRVGRHAPGESRRLHEKNRRINLYPVSGKKKI